MEKIHLQIESLIHENASDFEIAKAVKKEIKIYYATLKDTFASSGGKDFLLKHTKKIDDILKLVYSVAQRDMFGDYLPMKNSLPMAMVAMGSYGREQLCVYSDIDLMLVYKNVSGYNMEKMIEKILYILWDTGLKLGHRVHEVDELLEVSRTDITIKTAIIESRLIQGSLFLWTEVENAIVQIRHDTPKKFIEEKLEEQARKHKKYPLTMEPNLKEGVGGFRDANLVYWIGKVLYNVNNIKNLPLEVIMESDYRRFAKALEFLFRVRSALHLVARKKEDTLRLDLIPEVASYLGYAQSKEEHTKFSKKVITSLKTLRLYSKIWLEILSREYLEYQAKERKILYPKSELVNLNGLLSELIDNGDSVFEVHPTFLQKLIHIPIPKTLSEAFYANIQKIFYQKHAHSILNTLSYAKLLFYVIPPIAKVVNLPQFDGYHQYAVDIHSLKCLEHVENIQDSFIQGLFDALSIDEQMMLKMVVFLHDAGKGRITDHHLVGVVLFRKFALQLGVDEALIFMGEKLILHHTLMSRVAQREDLYNEKVILKFASHFPNKKLLDMIYILTYADMLGVGGDIYNSFSSKLIQTLYYESLESLKHENILSETAKRVKKETALKKTPAFLALKRKEQNKILGIFTNLLFIKYSPSEIVSICKKVFDLEYYSYAVTSEGSLSIEIVHKSAFNLGYVLHQLSSLKVIQMNCTKVFDTAQYCKIDFAESVTKEDILRIESFLPHAFERKERVSVKKLSIEEKDIRIDSTHSKAYWALYINAPDQKGFLAFLIETLVEVGFLISSAKIHTFRNRTKDIFLIEKDRNFSHNTEVLIKKLTGKS